ncbi:MAG TPA: PaaI family thioesterase [Stellaceae bacterium]|nr:PaaI family thioesterase [Stellaceae bacterium]
MERTALDRMPLPPSARLLGWRLLAHDPATQSIRVAFAGRNDFLNPAGSIQGGIQAAMLDDTMGPALWLATEGRLYPATIEMSLQFLHPAPPGPLFGEARVTKLGSTIAFLEGQLLDRTGRMLTRATACARLLPAGEALCAASPLPRPANDAMVAART